MPAMKRETVPKEYKSQEPMSHAAKQTRTAEGHASMPPMCADMGGSVLRSKISASEVDRAPICGASQHH